MQPACPPEVTQPVTRVNKPLVLLALVLPLQQGWVCGQVVWSSDSACATGAAGWELPPSLLGVALASPLVSWDREGG